MPPYAPAPVTTDEIKKYAAGLEISFPVPGNSKLVFIKGLTEKYDSLDLNETLVRLGAVRGLNADNLIVDLSGFSLPLSKGSDAIEKLKVFDRQFSDYSFHPIYTGVKPEDLTLDGNEGANGFTVARTLDEAVEKATGKDRKRETIRRE